MILGRWGGTLAVLAGLAGAAGVALAATAAHRVQSPALVTAAQMLQVHAAATLAVVAIAVTRQGAVRVWLLAASMLTGGAVLFALALALPPLAGITLFPMAAPIGGSTMMVAWLLVAVAAAAEWRERRN